MRLLEHRSAGGTVELRASRPGAPVIGGYAAVFGRLSRDLGGFVEVVSPAAFNRARGHDWPGALARFEHDRLMLLGTAAAGTLRLTIDRVGLGYEVDPPLHRADVVELVERGDIRHSSFAFRTLEDDWGLTGQGYPLRTLLAVQLVDVAPVVEPAYPDATAALRSLALHADRDVGEVRELAAARELGTLWGRPARSRPTPNRSSLLGAAARQQLLERGRDLERGRG